MKNNKADFSKETYLNLIQAAEYTHLGPWALRGYVKKGFLAAFKPQKMLLFKRADLDQLINKSEIKIPSI